MTKFFLFLITFLVLTQSCQHAGGPVKQSTIIDYLKSLIVPFIPINIPSIEFRLEGGFYFNISKAAVEKFDISSANMQLTKPNTVLFTLQGLVASLRFDWRINESGKVTNGTAQLDLLNCKGSTTTFVQTDHFDNIDATFVIGDLTFQTSNQPVIQPYWDLFKPVVVDTLQREVPNIILQFNTNEVKRLVYPIVKSVEPVHVPDKSVTVLGVTGGFANMTLNNIDFSAATLGRSTSDNEILFELTKVTALITNNWAFSGFGVSKSGSGHVLVNETTVRVWVGIGEDDAGEFTVNLDKADIVIGDLDIRVDGGNEVILNWMISEFKPLLIDAIESSFQVVVCVLFDGIPNK